MRNEVGEQGRRRTALRRSHLAHPLPETVETTPRLRLAAGQQTGCENDRVHCAGTRAADRIKGEMLLFEQAVENAPGEGAQRASTLERQRQVPFPRAALVSFDKGLVNGTSSG